MAKYKRWAEAAAGLIFIFIPCTVRTVSMPRYVMGSFLPVLGCVDMLIKFPWWFKISVVMVLTVGEFILFYGWLTGWDVQVI